MKPRPILSFRSRFHLFWRGNDQTHNSGSKAGNECLKVDFTTPWRTFSVYFLPVVKREYLAFMAVTKDGTTPPDTVTYQKVGSFYRIYDYNKQAESL